MNLAEFLEFTYNTQDLKKIARKMGLSDRGRPQELVLRISEAFVRWLPECLVGDTLYRLYELAPARKLRQVSARLTSNIEGSDRELFEGVARKIPELSERAEDWLFPPHLRFVLMYCYGKRGLQRIAREMDLDGSGAPHAVVERVSRYIEKAGGRIDTKRVISRLRIEADEDSIQSVCEMIGIPHDGGKKKLFKVLRDQIPELARLTKPEYFQRLEAKVSNTIIDAHASGQGDNGERYST